MPSDCLKQLGDGLSLTKPDQGSLIIKDMEKVVNTKNGLVTAATSFTKKLSVSKRYKTWLTKRGVPWVSKGNNPILYEKEFLDTLAPDDFVGLQGMVNKEAAGATLTGHSYDAELAKRFGISKGHQLYGAELSAKRITDDVSKRGMRINEGYLQKKVEDFTKDMHRLEREIKEPLGEFRIGSSEDLGKIMESKGIKVPRTYSGKYSVTDDVLQEAAKKDEIWGKVAEWRKAQHRRGQLLTLQGSVKEGRIHTTYDGLKTPTGRIQSEAPNMKNISTDLKDAVIADEGKEFLEVDWHQQEMRIMAAQADIKVWKQAFVDGVDLHTATAAEIYKVPIEGVTKQMRDAAKTLNLGQMQGQTPYGAAKALGISEEEAKVVIDKYHGAVPELKAFQEKVSKLAIKERSVETAFGRRRDLQAEIQTDLDKAKRQAVNTKGQGTAADLLKKTMKDLEPLSKDGIEMANFMDDAILFQIPEGMDRTAALDKVRRIMERPFQGIKMSVEGKAGKSWGQMEIIEGKKSLAVRPENVITPVEDLPKFHRGSGTPELDLQHRVVDAKWAIYKGKVYVDTRSEFTHADWFAEMGLPASGKEYDSIARGYLKKKNIVWWADTGNADNVVRYAGELQRQTEGKFLIGKGERGREFELIE